MSLPQDNATLTRVTTATAATGNRDDWDEAVAGAATQTADEPAGAGAEKWAGTERAYFYEKADRVAGPEGVTILTRRALVVPTAVHDLIGVDHDDVLHFTVDRTGQELQATAASIRVADLDGIPDELRTTRYELAVA